jgi:hypothetical protein
MSPELQQLAFNGHFSFARSKIVISACWFEHSRDREAIRMAAFTSPEADDRTKFERRWARLRSDGSTTNRIVEIDGRVVGHIASFDLEGHREVTYLDRS